MATTTATATAPQQPPISLPPPFSTSTTSLEPITRGAEAILYRTTFLSPTTPAALKYRPPKPWRHPTLERRLTKQRILAEARVLVKCRREGVKVPAVWGVDAENGWVVCEWVPGRTVKEVIRKRSLKEKPIKNGKSENEGDGGAGKGKSAVEGVVEDVGEEEDEESGLRGLMGRVGEAVGKLHAVGVIHGDLTTSNMILRPERKEDGSGSGYAGEIVLIDFGLATQGVQDEDKAVDLYVLERAFASTHPKEEKWFADLLEAYGKSYKGAKATLKRLEDVRMRGRKKSMIG